MGAAYADPPKGRSVQVGVRPDYTELSSMAGVPVQVRRVADLGRKRLAYVTLGGQQIVATVPPEMSSIGDQARVVFDPAHTHVYVDDIRATGAAA